MKSKVLIALLLSAASLFAADPMPPVVVADPPPPVIQLPPPNPVGVVKYDPLADKARDVPYHLALTKVPEAWAKNPAAKGGNVKIAIVDTWGQADHPGFDGKVKGTYSAITKKENPPRPAKPHPHCTHCAGIAHAVAPDADLYLIEGMNSKGSGTTADLAHGIDYAVSVYKVDVISCSFGGPTADPYLPAAIKRAVAAGVVVICAAGNDGGNATVDTEGYPARYDGSVSVAACDAKRQLAAFSSWGPSVFTTAPGVDITSLLPDDQEGEMSGTSMSCPLAAGECASWIASNAVPKEANRHDHFRAAVRKASPFAERNNARGYGMYTLDKITGDPTAQPPPPKPGEKVYTISLSELAKQGYTSVRIDLGGTPASGQPIPVASFPTPSTPLPYGGGVIYHHPQPVYHPITPGVIYHPAPQYAPPPVYYQQPQTCPPGGCQPQLLFPLLHRVLR
jgi:major intracellular serine protease